MKPLKVLQLLPALDSGGVERGTLEIARALIGAGHESVVLSKGGRLVEQLQREGSRHIARDLGRKSPATFLQYRALRRLFEQERFDIVHARSRLPAWVAWLAWRGMPAGARPHFVTTVHGMHSVSLVRVPAHLPWPAGAGQGIAGGLTDLLGRGVQAAVADVGGDGIVEEKRVLGDDADVIAQRGHL